MQKASFKQFFLLAQKTSAEISPKEKPLSGSLWLRGTLMEWCHGGSYDFDCPGMGRKFKICEMSDNWWIMFKKNLDTIRSLTSGATSTKIAS